MRSFKIILSVCLTALLITPGAIAQTTKVEIPVKDVNGIKSVTIAPGPRFAASRGKQFWWGAHWRKEWITPVPFPVFDMDTTAGGLTVLKRGGGHETKTLRLQGKNGREYVLRTMDKSLDVLIPEEFKGTFVNDIINDQISTAHPYGPLVVAHLSGSIGIMHTNPVIAFVPDSKRLGEFRNDFANKLCLFEERTSGEGWENTAITRFADDVINSEKLFEKLRTDNNKRVDQKEYLKIRLFDMLINDWDRHEDQWVWTGQKKDGKTVYQAFARDRDQSFSKTDGVNLWLISRPWALRVIQNMNPDIKDVIGTNLSATALDRQFTNELSETDWRNIIEALQKLLTDDAIREALHRMPDTAYALSGDFLYERLRARRDNMPDFGMRYYRIINKEVMITGSDDEELFTINKADDHTTDITIQAFTKKHHTGDTLFHRIFNHDVTKAINLHGLDDNDEFIYEGKTNNRIFVRTFGGDGKDVFIDSLSHSHHMKKSSVYDVPADAPVSSKAFHYHATNDTSVTNYHRKWFKYDWWMPLIFPGYNPDDGVLIGAALTYKKQQWHKNPFGWQQTFGGTYAFSTGAYTLFYKGKFKQVFGQWDLDLTANYHAPSYVVNFYGFDNDSKLSVKEKPFYRVRATSFFFNPEVSRTWAINTFSGGLIFNTVKVETADNKFISQVISGIDSSVFHTKNFGGANISYTLNTSNNRKYPTRGINYHIGSSYLVNLKDGKRNFVNLQSSFTFYYTPFRGITLAHRTGAATNLGDYEFYQANTLGGSENLRGYWRTRFTGKSDFYQNTDIRWKLAELKGYVLRGGFGIYGFFDDGRVWVKDDNSDKFHTGYGGGVYLIPYSTLALNLFFATSNEVNVFTFRAGFLF
jgi:hypothetical protein